MARKKTASRAMVAYRAPAQKAPIVNVRVAQPKKAKHRRGGRGHGKGNLQKTMMGSAIGGYALGFVEKQFPNLPSVPVLGKKGTIALVAYFLANKGGQLGTIARDVAIVAAGVAGYQYGSTGTVSGDIVKQVSGLAAQV
jgi:hypothetical protein